MSAMTDNPNASCEERIEGYLAGRVEGFREILKGDESDDDSVREEALDRWSELPLSIEVVRVVKILLSTGGPADWFEATLDDEGAIVRVEYVFQDWFDGARRPVDLNSPEGEDIERFLSYYIDALEQ